MNNQKYTAFTVGPIFDTMELASKPGALWTASYMFSYLTRSLCEALVESGLPEKNIVTPFYTQDPEENDYGLLNKNDGVGLFHDRVIFAHDEKAIIDIKDIKTKALEKVFVAFGFDENAKKFLNEYILIGDVTFDAYDEKGNAVNPILKSGEILDSIELSKRFAHRSDINPLLTVFEGSSDKRKNETVKALPAVGGLDSWQLWKNDSKKVLKSLGDIACGSKYDLESEKGPKPDLKKHYYYAIVRSDGDNMGSVISRLGNDNERIREYSKKCLNYCSDIADKVYKEFSGATIYSGGDDLLAVLPCESQDAKNVFEYIKAANDIFAKHFGDTGASLSFGITICYYKFPLYEALNESAELLFDKAKSDEYGKNCAAVNLHKHSGQSAGIVIKNGESLDELLKLCNMIKDTENKDEKEPVLLSVLYKLDIFKALFYAAGSNEEGIRNLFDNCFDAPAHDIDFIKKKIPEFYISLVKGDINIKAIPNKEKLFAENEENENKRYINVNTMCSVLRMLKFLTERAGDN